MAKHFDDEKENLSSDASKETLTATNEGVAMPSAAADFPQSPVTSDYHNAEWVFSQDEGFSTTEPVTPNHDTIEIVVLDMVHAN